MAGNRCSEYWLMSLALVLRVSVTAGIAKTWSALYLLFFSKCYCNINNIEFRNAASIL